MKTIIDNRQAYYQKRFEYFGGEVEWIECVNSVLNEMIEPIQGFANAFKGAEKACIELSNSSPKEG